MMRRGLDGGSFKPLTEDSIHRIHQTAMRVIGEVGFEVNSETALELFEGAGAWVDREKRLVRLTQKRAME
ncbi:MAG: trimethylamine methyltransferase family protein, partial [Dehalococcoidia bacterium]